MRKSLHSFDGHAGLFSIFFKIQTPFDAAASKPKVKKLLTKSFLLLRIVINGSILGDLATIAESSEERKFAKE
jgi:hypothetical protein